MRGISVGKIVKVSLPREKSQLLLVLRVPEVRINSGDSKTDFKVPQRATAPRTLINFYNNRLFCSFSLFFFSNSSGTNALFTFSHSIQQTKLAPTDFLAKC